MDILWNYPKMYEKTIIDNNWIHNFEFTCKLNHLSNSQITYHYVNQTRIVNLIVNVYYSKSNLNDSYLCSVF